VNVFEVEKIQNKIQGLEDHIQGVLNGQLFSIPDLSVRDVEVKEPLQHPPKKGLSSKEGQARLLHDLASIELQAMELALRTLTEYHQEIKGTKYLDLLVQLILSERSHLQLCVKGIQDLGFDWGQWPVHMALWKSVGPEDSLIDRVFIVHRYLEGSGLDAADTLLRRLSGVKSNFFFKKDTLQKVRAKLPKRLEPINSALRLRALFSESEIDTLKKYQKETP